jgi:hypothetical protein
MGMERVRSGGRSKEWWVLVVCVSCCFRCRVRDGDMVWYMVGDRYRAGFIIFSDG